MSEVNNEGLYERPTSFIFEAPDGRMNTKMNQIGLYLFIYSIKCEPMRTEHGLQSIESGWLYAKDMESATKKFDHPDLIISLDSFENILRKKEIERMKS